MQCAPRQPRTIDPLLKPHQATLTVRQFLDTKRVVGSDSPNAHVILVTDTTRAELTPKADVVLVSNGGSECVNLFIDSGVKGKRVPKQRPAGSIGATTVSYALLKGYIAWRLTSYVSWTVWTCQLCGVSCTRHG